MYKKKQRLNCLFFPFSISHQAAVKSNLEPGKAFTLPFTVFTTGSGGEYTINAKNDRDFKMDYQKR